MAFPPHPCYGLPGRHCLSGHLPQRQQFPHFPAVAEWLFRRILAKGFLDGIVSPATFHNGSNFRISLPLRNFFSAASLLWASWTALSPRTPSTTALITAFSCRCGKDRRAHLPKVIRILPDLAHLRKVERGGWKRKRGHRRYGGPREIAHLRKVSRNAEKHDSFRRSEEVSGKLWNEGDAKGWTGPKREGGGVCRKPMPGLREPPVKRISL